jgi:hypothetical protein
VWLSWVAAGFGLAALLSVLFSGGGDQAKIAGGDDDFPPAASA